MKIVKTQVWNNTDNQTWLLIKMQIEERSWKQVGQTIPEQVGRQVWLLQYWLHYAEYVK